MTKVRTLADQQVVEKLKYLISEEKKNVAAQIVLLKEVKRRKLAIALGYPNLMEFCQQELGLTANQAWKRSQAAGVVAKEPLFLNMLNKGETSVAALAVIAPKLTDETAEELKAFIPQKSRREAEAFIATINRDGSRNDQPATVKVPLQLRPATIDKLNRVRKLLRQSKAELSDDQLMDDLLEHILERRDPARKAARAKARQAEKREKNSKERPNDIPENSLEKTSPKKAEPKRKRYLPAASRHAVHGNEDYRCSYVGPQGQRCPEVTALQVDHKKMFSQGGGHEPENLRLMCSAHNRYLAELVIGQNAMQRSG